MPAVARELSVRTHCPYCAFQCGVRMGDPFAAGEDRVQGDPHFPVNNGQLCIKGWTSFALLRHPARLLTPLVRDRRSEPFREADWDEALDRVAAGMIAAKTIGGPDANGVFGSGALTNETAYLLGKFSRLALATANVDYNGRYCMSSAAAGANRAFGLDRGLPFPVSDFAHADLIVLVGANSADTLPPIVQWLQKQKANGGRLAVVDPRATPTTRLADLHVQVTPGTDLALANGLLHLAIEEGFLDREFVAARTNGFDAVRAAVLDYHPAHVERLTGVPEATLRRLVRWMGTARACMVLSGRGAEQHSKGVDTVHAWINLALALGLPGKAYSGWGCLTGQGNGQGGREHGQKADQLPGYRLIENPAHRAAVASVWGVDPASLPAKGKSAFELLDALGPGGVRSLFVMGSNVAVASPDTGRIEKRLAATDFLAVCDAFPNETTALADVVLPVLQWSEDEGTMTNFEGRVIRRRRTTRPPTGPRSDLDILRALADRLGAGRHFEFESPREVFAEFRRATSGGAADYAGISYERIDAEDGVFWPCPADDHPGTPRPFAERFAHPDGKAKFFPVQHRPAGDETSDEFPYLFTTGRDKEHYNSGAQTRRVERLTAEKPAPRLQLHPAVAARHGISPGSPVALESRRGRAEFVAEVTADVRPDVLFAAFHWGGRQAANRLTGGFLDPVSRMPEFKLAAVRVVASVRGEREGSMKRRLAIVGNGMAAGRLLDELVRRNAQAAFDIAVYGEEAHGCYNRVLLGRVLAGGAAADITTKPADWYAGRGVTYHPNTRVEKLTPVARELHAADGRSFAYDVAVLATGSAPVVPPLDGLRAADGTPKPGAFLFRTLDDCAKMNAAARPAAAAVVLGGGLLGLEAAKALSDLGMHVTVVHQPEWLMNQQADRTAGEFIRRGVERLGVFVRTGATAVGVIGTDRVQGVVLKSGEVLPADLFVIAAGVRPRVDVAAASGLPVKRGIVVNDLLATAAPGVFAVGECAEHNGVTYGVVPPVWEQCGVLADVLTAANPQARYRGSKVYTKLKVAGIEVASMGLVEPQADADEVIQIVEDRRGIYRKLIVRDGKLVGATLVGDADGGPSLARWFDRGDPLPPNRLDVLCSGDVSPAAADREVCNCHHVCESTLVAAIKDGCTSLPQLSAATQAGTGCGSCRGQLANLILKTAGRAEPVPSMNGVH